MKLIASLLVQDGPAAPYAAVPAPDTTPARDTTTDASGLAIDESEMHARISKRIEFYLAPPSNVFWDI